MASAIIHLCVANELNKKWNKDEKQFTLGSIAPDLAKIIGENREKYHFILGDETYPDIDYFLSKYKENLNNDFVLGYFVHLYTDYLWEKYFIDDFVKNGKIYTHDKKEIELTEERLVRYIYQDYTNLNISLLDEYELSLKIFYEEVPSIKDIIKEINSKEFQKLLDAMGLIVKNTKIKKTYIFDIENVKKFINTSVNYILSYMEEL